jgi:hypothetical protein
MIQFCGQHGAESILLARNPGHILWTDDFMIAAYSQENFGIRRVWTQVVLARLTSEGFFPLNDYWKASAILLGYNYVAMRYNAPILRSAALIAEWESEKWPLKQALNVFAKSQDLEITVIIAAQFIHDIFNEPITLPSHGEIIMTIFDRFADGPLGITGFKALRRCVKSFFGVNVSAAQDADNYFRHWLELRGIDM